MRSALTPRSRRVLVSAGSAFLVACAPGNPENRAACGITILAAANRVLEQMRAGTKMLDTLPATVRGVVPARVVGRGTRPALAATSDSGTLIAFDGEGFPTRPGFGLALVEDSAEVFQGILIFDLEPPTGFREVGKVVQGSQMVPLYGMRVTWAAVSSSRCPLFGPVDSTITA